MPEVEPNEESGLAATFVGVLIRPRATFARLGQGTRAQPGASAVALLGMAWGGLCLVLWRAGIEPAFVLVPVPPRDWYLVQGLLSLPILTALWWLFSEVSHRLARRAGGVGKEPGVRAALGFAYAVPTLVHVLVESAAFLSAGQPGLRAVARVSMPLSALGVWVLSTLALRATHSISGPAAVGAAFVGLLVQALVGSLILR